MFIEFRTRLIAIGKKIISSPRAIVMLSAIIIATGFLSQISQFLISIEPTIAGVFLICVIITLVFFLVRDIRQKPVDIMDNSGEDIDVPSTQKANRLTRLVKLYLDAIWFLFLGIAVLLPFFAAVISIDYFAGQTGIWGVDLSVFWGFAINLEQLTDMSVNVQGLRDGVISGKAMMNIETISVVAWYLFIAINEVMLLIVLYSLYQMRGLFTSLVKGVYFTVENSIRIKKVGIAVILGNIIVPIMQYFGGRAMLDDIQFNIPGFEIYPAFQDVSDGLFLGILILILAGVAREAANIYEEQLRTI
ncbi:MAG: DUF2975 domain-containing protein [Emcibacter sp.]|nr:DUF2975 domain-containing protein [Emcibacter sp.]